MMNWSSCGSNVKRKADRPSKGWTLNIHWSCNFMNINSSWHSYKTAINDMYIMFLHKAFFAFTRFIILLWRKKITIFNLHWNLHFLDFSTVRCTCVKCEMDAHCTLLVISHNHFIHLSSSPYICFNVLCLLRFCVWTLLYILFEKFLVWDNWFQILAV